MKLWCFGDSNTYGCDPRGFFGGRYAALQASPRCAGSPGIPFEGKSQASSSMV